MRVTSRSERNNIANIKQKKPTINRYVYLHYSNLTVQVYRCGQQSCPDKVAAVLMLRGREFQILHANT